MRDELEKLIWEEADEALSPAGRDRLAHLLATAPDAAVRRSEIARIRRQLSELPDVPPPAEMYESVRTALDAVRQERRREAPRRGTARSGLSNWLRGASRGSWRLRYAYALLGAVIASLAVAWLSQPHEERDKLKEEYFYGSLSEARESWPGCVLGDGLLSLERQGHSLIAVAQSADGVVLEVTLEQAGRGMRLLELNETASSVANLSITGGRRLSFTHRGTGRVELRLSLASDLPVAVRISSAGRVLVDRSLDLNEIPAR